MKLDVLIEKDETGYYVAEVPALPGCLSQGKTLAEAEENIKEAIELWLEVMNEKTPPLQQEQKNISAKELLLKYE
ncbi:MAG: type II toxin-antitoxin system HicB family antitoxin [Cytophagales bacterium]|nr:type II toxin-antitoxin system HicB family antitoxin [Cytophagales bacterium]